MLEHEVRVKETMSRARVNQCQKWQANKGIGGEQNCDGVGSRKSGCIESNLVCHMNGVNTVISLCGGQRTADYFLVFHRSRFGLLFHQLHFRSFGFAGGRSGLRTLTGYMSSFTAEKANVVVKLALLFYRGKLAIFPEFVRKVRSHFPVV
jgi:hypothetical protein